MHAVRIDAAVFVHGFLEEFHRLREDGLVQLHARAKEPHRGDERRTDSDARRLGERARLALTRRQKRHAVLNHLPAQSFEIALFGF